MEVARAFCQDMALGFLDRVFKERELLQCTEYINLGAVQNRQAFDDFMDAPSLA